MNRCFKNVSFVLFVYIIFYKNICQVQEPPKGRLKAHYSMDNREWKKKILLHQTNYFVPKYISKASY